MTFDNVNKTVGYRHQGAGQKTTMMNLIYCFSTQNRTPTQIYEAKKKPSFNDVNSIPLSAYLPTVKDRPALEDDICNIVSCRLQKNMPLFAATSDVETMTHTNLQLNQLLLVKQNCNVLFIFLHRRTLVS